MKSKRTIRTLRRAGLSEAEVGFANFLPTGKRVRALARMKAAERRLLTALPAQVGNAFFGAMPLKAALKAASSYASAPKPVQEAWNLGV